SVFMPYCLRKQEDGRYVILNREYKPVGFFTNEYVKYEEHPVAVHLEGISPATAAKLSWNGSKDTNSIFLYNDGCIPTDGAENMKKYIAKLQILAILKITRNRDGKI
ncbi:hypothetical protein, partial [Acidithiobacillus ferrooxidans]|uniref:hypothetical protein n=1 Tax=Acidithiobacillus ferrooxidans TaxID=920 RepID=UPI000AB3AD67